MQSITKISSINDINRIYQNSTNNSLQNFENAKANTKSDSLTLSDKSKDKVQESKNAGNSEQSLSEEEKAVVQKLKQRDEEVKRHEQAHLSAGGGLVRGGASFSYQTGPDGMKYAIGGEVQIDISSEEDPKATITKMQQVKRAALAPSDPSSQDRAVAAMASKIEAQAAAELREQTSGQSSSKGSSNSNVSPQAKLALEAYRKASGM